MERFELLDILSQDKHGIVYVAWDSVLARKVTIRRFLPFGQDGGGLDKAEVAAFESASKRLAELQHDALRSVMLGGVDPIDAIPYLVNEWVEGVSLKTFIQDTPMEPAVVIDVLRIALEMSVILSEVLGEDAVWVETEPEAIYVGAEETGRGFTFWISPFKWLGGEQQSRKLSSIVTLGEELTGWKKKLVSDNAGFGLGGWLKWLKRNPDVSLSEALKSLAVSTGQGLPPVEESDVEEEAKAIAQEAPRPAARELKQASSKTPMIIAAVLAIAVVIVAVIYVTRPKEVPSIATKEAVPAEKVPKISDSPAQAPAMMATVPPVESATARVNALAEKLQREAAERSGTAIRDENSDETPPPDDVVAKKSVNLAQERELLESRGFFLSPDQAALVRTFKNDDPVKIKGVLHGIRASESGKTIYLAFSDPEDFTLTNAVMLEKDFEGSYSLDEFRRFIGKSVAVSGTVYSENARNAYFVKITKSDQITEVLD